MKYIVLLQNEDKYCGGDFAILNNRKELLKFLKYNSFLPIYYVFRVYNSNDISSSFKNFIKE